jgi:hypothetical protein
MQQQSYDMQQHDPQEQQKYDTISNIESKQKSPTEKEVSGEDEGRQLEDLYDVDDVDIFDVTQYVGEINDVDSDEHSTELSSTIYRLPANSRMREVVDEITSIQLQTQSQSNLVDDQDDITDNAPETNNGSTPTSSSSSESMQSLSPDNDRTMIKTLPPVSVTPGSQEDKLQRQESRDSMPKKSRMKKVATEIARIARNRRLRETEERQHNKDSLPRHSRMIELAQELSSIALRDESGDDIANQPTINDEQVASNTIAGTANGSDDGGSSIDDNFEESTFVSKVIVRRRSRMRKVADEILSMVINSAHDTNLNSDEGSTVIDEIASRTGDFYESDDYFTDDDFDECNDYDHYDEERESEGSEEVRMKQIVEELLMIAESESTTPARLRFEAQIRRSSIPQDSPMRQVVDEIILHSSSGGDNTSVRSANTPVMVHPAGVSGITPTSHNVQQRRDSIPTHNRMQEIIIEVVSNEQDPTKKKEISKEIVDDKEGTRRDRWSSNQASTNHVHTVPLAIGTTGKPFIQDKHLIPLDIGMVDQSPISTIADDETARRRKFYYNELLLDQLRSKEQERMQRHEEKKNKSKDRVNKKYEYNSPTPKSPSKLRVKKDGKQRLVDHEQASLPVSTSPKLASPVKLNRGIIMHLDDPPPFITSSPKGQSHNNQRLSNEHKEPIRQDKNPVVPSRVRDEGSEEIIVLPDQTADSNDTSSIAQDAVPVEKGPAEQDSIPSDEAPLIREESVSGRPKISSRGDYLTTPRMSNVQFIETHGIGSSNIEDDAKLNLNSFRRKNSITMGMRPEPTLPEDSAELDISSDDQLSQSSQDLNPRGDESKNGPKKPQRNSSINSRRQAMHPPKRRASPIDLSDTEDTNDKKDEVIPKISEVRSPPPKAPARTSSLQPGQAAKSILKTRSTLGLEGEDYQLNFDSTKLEAKSSDEESLGDDTNHAAVSSAL